MTVRESLDLSNFLPAIEQLAMQISNVGSDEKLIADASVALSSGIAAMAMFQTAPAGPPIGNWEGALDDHSLCLFSATHQLVFTLENSMFQAAVLSGPSCITWNIIRSDKGLHVQAADASAEIIKDRLIKPDGSIVDANDTTAAMQELKAEWQKIANMPEAGLPAYIPEGDLPDIDLPDIESLPDVNSSLPDDDRSSGPSGGGRSGSGGPSSGSSSGSFGSFPFPKDSPSGSNSDFAGKAVNAAGNLLKGAAAVAAAGIAARVMRPPKSAAPDKTPEAQDHAEKAAASKSSSPVSSQPPQSQTEAVLILEVAGLAPITVNVFPWVLGRSNDCQMALSSKLVSRRHAQIIQHEDHICFEDLNSSNGSWLNGEKPTGKMPIYKGDELKIADVPIKIVDGPKKPEPDSQNIATMMFNVSDSLHRTQEIPAIKEPLPPAPARPLNSPLSVPPSQLPRPAEPVRPAAPPPLAPPPRPARPLPPSTPLPPAPPPRPARPLPPAAPLPPAPPPRPAKQVRQSAPPPPSSAIEESLDDYVANAVQAARGHSGDSGRSDKPAKQSIDRRSSQQPDEPAGQIKQAEPDDYKPISSVRWVSFIFGLFFVSENLRILSVAGGAALEQQSFLLSAGFGIATVFFAFIAGSSRGFFRFLTLVTSGAYVGVRLSYNHAMLLSIIENIAEAQDNLMLLLPLLSVITAAWIAKRASGR
ncbi:MAG: FHA domain-containing protein [Candidatus Riflebacteria bacterium]|nr:FHA domain-containing protein [Candidatus Riflebacteria bacterium]